MEIGAHNSPRTVEEVFKDFKGRRIGLIKALTTGVCLFLFFFFLSIFRVSILSFLFRSIGCFELCLALILCFLRFRVSGLIG